MRAACVLVLASMVSAMLACSSTESVSQGTGGAAGDASTDAHDAAKPEGSAGAGGCVPDKQVASQTCAACITATSGDAGVCAASRDACLADNECTAIIDCWQGCTDATCESQCITQHPGGSDTLLPFMACGDTACHDECFCAGCRFGTAAMCNPCLEEHCMQACSGCDRDAQCMALVYCMVYTCAPDDVTCQNACGNQFSAGVTPYVAMANCGQDQCTQQCGFEVPDAGDAGDTGDAADDGEPPEAAAEQ